MGFLDFLGYGKKAEAPVVEVEEPETAPEIAAETAAKEAIKKQEEDKAARMKIFEEVQKKAEAEMQQREEAAVKKQAKEQELVIAIMKALNTIQTDEEILAQENFVLPTEMNLEQMKQIIDVIKSYESSTIMSLLEPTKQTAELKRFITTIQNATPQTQNNDGKGLFHETGIREEQFIRIIPYINSFLKSFSDKRKRERELKEFNKNLNEQNELNEKPRKRVGGKKRKTKKMKKTKKRKNHKKRTSCNKRS